VAKLNVNGRVVEIQVEDDTPLLWVLREQLGLTGTKYGCGVAQCGACTVHVDGAAVRACAMPVSAFTEGQKITTIEGLSPDSSHPIQQTWLALDVLQEMTNICRCGTYNRVIAGIQRAAGISTSG